MNNGATKHKDGKGEENSTFACDHDTSYLSTQKYISRIISYDASYQLLLYTTGVSP